MTLALTALGLAGFGVFSFVERTASQALVLIAIGAIAAAAAYLLSDGPSVRIPTPARLDELAGRAEKVAIGKAGD